MPKQTTTASPTAAPAELPNTGMVCLGRFGRKGTFVWKSDGSITKLPDLTLFEIGMNGDLAQRIDDGPITKDTKMKLVSLTHRELPSVPLPNWLARTWMQPNGDTLYANDIGHNHDVEVWRGGAWTKLADASSNSVAVIDNVVEHEGAFWFTSGSQLYREEGSRIEKLDVDGSPAAIVETSGELSVFYTRYEEPLELMRAPITKGKIGQGHSVGTLIDRYISDGHAVTHGKSWALYAGAGAFGTVHAFIGGKLSTPTREGLDVIAIDGHDRLFYRTREGVVVLSPDGTTTTYPKAASELFQLERPHCAVLGQGFEALPPVPAGKTGTLRVVVEGARNAPIAVCPDLPGAERCETSVERINGTLDAHGEWSRTVPIGTYNATVNIDGAWLVPDVSDPVRTKPWHCEVRENRSCKIELRKSG